MEKKIKILVVDDHPVVRKGISLCLAPYGNMEIVGELGDADEVAARARELKPDVVLMDIDLPQINGLTATALLRRELPEIKVLILSVHDHPGHVREAMQAGARGYLLKSASAEELARAVEAVHRGETCFSADMMRAALDQFMADEPLVEQTQLTDREREVLVLVAESRSNTEIAAILGVRARTVESHRANLMRKLNVHSAAGLVRFAVAKGYVPARPGRAAI